MAFDQSSMPKGLRPLNVARALAEEPLLVPAAATGGTLDGYSNLVQETGSPPPVIYPATVSDTGLLVHGYGNQVPGLATWHSRGPASDPALVGHVRPNPVGGFNCGPNLVNRLVNGSADRPGKDMVSGFGSTQILGTTDSGNGNDQSNTEGITKNSYDSNSGTRDSGNGAEFASEEGGGDLVSGKKVKFLCSFGGKILPRPSDGMLRYVGGQTRIISVRRDLSFEAIVQKMRHVYGQPVVIKYQLPDEDLDTLVSVACLDDLDNMMDEYERLIESSSDGSSKLRVFLFSASELESSGMFPFGDLRDGEQKYVEAVNGVTDGFSGGITRKGSMASAFSTQNSGFCATDAVEPSGLSQGNSGPPQLMNVLSTAEKNSVLLHDTMPISVSGRPGSTVHPDSYAVPRGIPVKSGPLQASEVMSEGRRPVIIQPQQQPEQYLPQPGIAPAPRYVQAYIDPHQEVLKQPDYVHLPSKMEYANPNLLASVGAVYTQPQIHSNTSGVSSHQFTPTMHMAMTSPPSHAGIRPFVIQPLMQNQETRLECYPEENSRGARVVQLPTEKSYRVYEAQVLPGVVGGAYGWHQVAATDCVAGSDRPVAPHKVMCHENFPRLEDCSMCEKVLPHTHSDPVVQDKVTGPISDSVSVYHRIHPDAAMRIRQQNRVMDTESLGTTPSEVSGFSDNVEMQQEQQRNALQRDIAFASRVQASELPLQQNQKEYSGNLPSRVPGENIISYDYLRPINGLMENLHVSSAEMNTDGEKDILLIDISKPHQTEGGNISSNDAFDPNQIGSTQIPLDSRSEVSPVCETRIMESHEIVQPPVIGNPGLYQHMVGGHNLNSEESHIGNPALETRSVADRVAPTIDWNSDSSWCQPNVFFSDTEAVALNCNVVSSISPVARNGEAQDTSNSLFSSQDPWNLHHDTHRPRPNKLQTKREAFGPRDHFGETHVIAGSVSNSEMQLHSGTLNPNKDTTTDGAASSKGSGDEKIKQDLQTVAEGVAASVFQSLTPSNPEIPEQVDESISYASQNEEDLNNVVGKQHRDKFEEIRNKIPEMSNFGFPVSDCIGKLQIIKNGDLEELRELGSGTFGTVYHGKWRGTDVAIKRINNRCFAGKASEQERMIEDFWNEAIKLADLHHPNVVAFYGIVLDAPGGSVATVTEYMVNGSLRNALQKNIRNLDKRKRLLIAMDVAFGMEYLHGKNIVHFDLKSDNLLVNLRDPHRPICKVGDLGLSKVKCQTLISGGVRGTLPWMAPELLNGSSSLVSEKVDVFSFGIVMWELLTGDEPYADLHYGAIIGGIVSNTLRPQVPDCCEPEWGSLMERCWSPDPSERPSFTEIANELRVMASKLPSKGQSPPQQRQTSQ